MQTKRQYIEKISLFVRGLNDLRFVGQLVFVVIVLLISWSGVKTVQTNYGLQKQISALKQQNSLQQLQNENLGLQNQYFNSNQYLELAARQNFGLAAAGETEIVVPQQVALAYTVNLPDTSKPNAAKAKQPAYQRNFQSWIDLFLHHQNTQY
jgi:cell division protein FtsB